ncbi:hypothetical protein, partial [Pyxidicoccus fallax]|uniref:hypothetical protein n=1 Tax=Pyxidicoccus fallax TaxID=394095 RepID=UPI001B7D6E88
MGRPVRGDGRGVDTAPSDRRARRASAWEGLSAATGAEQTAPSDRRARRASRVGGPAGLERVGPG